jgi:glycosyltransferase involved in cell wall biosynthesis
MLAQFYPPVIGGEEQHVRNLSIQLAARGHQVAVATLRQPEAPDFEVDEGGVRVYRMQGAMQRAGWLFGEHSRRHAPPFPDPEVLWGLRKVIARERPDVVHAHNWLVHTYLPLKAQSHAPLAMTLHDYSLRCVKKRLMYKETACSGPSLVKCLQCAADHYGPSKGIPTLISNWAFGRAERRAVDRFLPVSRAVASLNALAENGLPFEVIPNFLPDELEECEEGWQGHLSQLPREEFLLLVGDLCQDKGVDVLLQAYDGLEARPPLVLIGRRLPDTPRHVPAGTRMFHDWSHRAVMGAWRRSMFAVVPSICPDACPTVALEAMASGRAVVGSSIGGLPDLIVDGENGYLVPPGDVQALRHALHRLVSSRDVRKHMGEESQRRVGEFRAASVVPRVERVYRELVDATSAQPKEPAAASAHA